MTNTHQPLALRADAPAVFGSRDEIKAIADRISVMLPSAHLSDWQLKQANRGELQKALDESVFRAAQLCVFYRLVPGEDVHVIPFGNSWAVDMGIETWKKSADRYCSSHGITYHIHTEEMSEQELRERRGENYHPDDYGMVAYLWRSDKKDVYEIFGAKASMSRAAGIWAKRARFNKSKNEWQEDNIPTQRSKQDVAKRRAMKAVLKLEFSLDSLLAATPAELRQNIQFLDRDIRNEQMRQAIPDTRRVEWDEDGCFATEPSNQRPTIDAVQFVVASAQEEANMEYTPDVDDIQDAQNVTDEAQGDIDDPVNYSALAKQLTGTAASFAAWTRKTHLNSNGPASVEQYRYLVGVLNSIAGNKEAYRLLLGVMLGRHVDSTNRPGINVTAKLLEWLVAEHKDEVTGEKVANPLYREDYAATVKAIWQTIAAQPQAETQAA